MLFISSNLSSDADPIVSDNFLDIPLKDRFRIKKYSESMDTHILCFLFCPNNTLSMYWFMRVRQGRSDDILLLSI